MDPATRFRLPAPSAAWAASLAGLRPDAASYADADELWPGGELDPAALDRRLRLLDVPAHDIDEVLGAGVSFAADPGLREFAARIATAFARARAAADAAGDGSGPDLRTQPGSWPSLADRVDTAAADAVRRWGWVLVYAAALPGLLRWHADHGLDPATSEQTVADVGAQVAAHRRITGGGGLADQEWLVLHATGRLVRVGRLQVAVGRAGPALAVAAGVPVGTGLLDLHVPATGGAMTPDACERSLAAAPGVVARLHPGLEPALITCTSWLLDDRLATVLPADSNIRAFAGRFTLLTRTAREEPDADIRRFLFSSPSGTDARDLPRDSSLRRAVADRMAAGEHWWTRSGWARLEVPPPGTATAATGPPHRRGRDGPPHRRGTDRDAATE